jgi:anthranilate phosphoribosyltransferase
MPLKQWVSRVVDGRDLSCDEMKEAMNVIMGGGATPAQIGAFLVGLRMKGETVDEITGAASVMRAHVARVEHGFDRVLDTCGTGGDGAGTFNISTTVAFVCAGAGVKVGKHGNRAISSRSGSADVLEALGVRLDLPLDAVSACLDAVGIAFLFAPAHHPAMRHVAGPRREMGVRTMMNLLGPLTNPAAATHQLVGIYDGKRVKTVAEVLGRLGLKRAVVVHGHDGLDEVSPCSESEVAEWRDGQVYVQQTQPEDVGLPRCRPEQLAGGNSADNAAIIQSILNGEPGAPRDAVLLNAAWALYAADVCESPRDGVPMAADVIDSGRARAALQNLIDFTVQ